MQPLRSESLAAVIFGLPFPAVSTYTVISRCSRCVFIPKRSINKLFSISNPMLSGGGSGLPLTTLGAPSPVVGTFALISQCVSSANFGSPTTMSFPKFEETCSDIEIRLRKVPPARIMLPPW